MSEMTKRHCQLCGSTAYEDVETAFDPEFQGYSRCCNELVLDACDEMFCDHGEVA